MPLPLLISLAVAASALLIVFGAVAGRGKGNDRDQLRDRLTDVGAESEVTDAQIQASIRRDTRANGHNLINRLLLNLSVMATLERWLVQARSNARPGDVVLKSVILAAIAGFAMYSTSGYVISGVVAGCAVGALPVFSVARRKKRRMADFNKQLPDAMTMIKNALRAGHTLNKAMAIVSEEMPDPLAIEFNDAVEEMRLGLPLSAAMSNLGKRMPSDNLNIFLAGVLIQHEVGGNLTELLDNIAKTIRERYRLDAEVKSLTAEGRISGVVIAVLPIALSIIISLMQPEYLVPLFETETGNKLLIAAMISETIGYMWIRKVCKVKF